MAYKKRGQLTASPEWAKHLRNFAGRWFWKGERRAERQLARRETPDPSSAPTEVGTVEDLLDSIDRLDPDASVAELCVPTKLSLDGEAVSSDVAMAIVVDKLLGLEFYPDGYREDRRGRTYIYRRN